EMSGLHVVDLGCGWGWFCRWARENGAAQVLGIDLSSRMLAQACANTSDPARLYAQIARCLKPGGHLVFSTEHPIFMAAAKPGWLTSDSGAQVWPVDSYFAEGQRRTDWIAKDVLKYHRTTATTLNLLIRSGFKIERIEEFCPTAEQIAARPALAEELQRPTFLLVSALRECTHLGRAADLRDFFAHLPITTGSRP